LAEIPVTGTRIKEDGSDQRDFSAIAMDPDDPNFLWVSGYES
jgi:hypothetical protein